MSVAQQISEILDRYREAYQQIFAEGMRAEQKFQLSVQAPEKALSRAKSAKVQKKLVHPFSLIGDRTNGATCERHRRTFKPRFCQYALIRIE